MLYIDKYIDTITYITFSDYLALLNKTYNLYYTVDGTIPAPVFLFIP